MNSAYKMVTSRILEELKKGVVPWKQPWRGDTAAYNMITGRQYSFLNQMMLDRGGPYLTWNQIRNLGGKVKKGEHASQVVFWKIPQVEENEEDAEKTERRRPPILRRYAIFHISQTEGISYEEKKPERIDFSNNSAKETFENYIAREKIMFEPGGDRAFYSPASDSIHIPSPESFESENSYWNVAYHEAAHSTGHSQRLNREGIRQISFGSIQYSAEELVAEITASFLSKMLGFYSDEEIKNSASYISSWISVLENDPKMIVFCAAKAEKAANYILNSAAK